MQFDNEELLQKKHEFTLLDRVSVGPFVTNVQRAKEPMKNFYETTFIVNPNLDDHQIENTVKMVEDTIIKNGCQIISIDQLGRRRLTYPIAKKHTGFYVCIEFEGEGKTLEKIERALKLEENVLRYLSLKLDKRELEAKRLRATARMELADAAGEAAPDAVVAVPETAEPAPENA